MTKWLLRTQDKKNVESHLHWQQGDDEIMLTERFRWGSVFIHTQDENPPVIDLENLEGILVSAIPYMEMNDLEDLYSDNWDFDGCDVDEEGIQEGWEDRGFDYMESAGWISTSSEIWFYGPLSLEKNTETV